jgi:hypothetical protein
VNPLAGPVGTAGAVAFLSCAAVGGLAFADGGYFATSWGWATLAFAAVAIVSVQLRTETRLVPLELAAVCALAGTTVWIALSAAWSKSVPVTVAELERSFVPLTALAAALLVARRATASSLALGVLGAAIGLGIWGLAADTGRPLGYANALAALCAMGILLAAGAALEWRRPLVLAICVGALLVFVGVIERSQSRAAWLALAGGAACWIALRGPRPALGVAVSLATVGAVLGIAGATQSDQRAEYWQVTLDGVARAPLLGSGAGTWQRGWLEHRDAAYSARDAHSLYLETLSELGPVGFGLLVAALAIPLVAALRAPRTPFMRATAGAYAAFLVHLAVDWDWEITAVAVAGMLLAASLLVRSRPSQVDGVAIPRTPAVAVFGAVALLALAGLAGHVATTRAEERLRAADWAGAEHAARQAARLAPWAAEPWRLRGEAERAQGRQGAAATSFRAALRRDAGDVELWRALSRVTSGVEQRRAQARAALHDPLGAANA